MPAAPGEGAEGQGAPRIRVRGEESRNGQRNVAIERFSVVVGGVLVVVWLERQDPRSRAAEIGVWIGRGEFDDVEETSPEVVALDRRGELYVVS